jgi:hypothetical protein
VSFLLVIGVLDISTENAAKIGQLAQLRENWLIALKFADTALRTARSCNMSCA